MNPQPGRSRTMFDKVWDAHQVAPETADTPAVLYADLHLVHEVTSPQAFDQLRQRGLDVRRPECTVATMDHSIPTKPEPSGRLVVRDRAAAEQVEALRRNCHDFGIRLFELGSPGRGIVHVIGPERGLTQP
ncbi:MAG: aconitase family protein, partial [Acidobacteriota bacterium]